MTEIYLALDNMLNDGAVKRRSVTMRTLHELNETKLEFGIKINLDYILWRGLHDAIIDFELFDRPMFVDLKMWNGRRTMHGVLSRLRSMPKLKYVTCYALGAAELGAAIADLGPTSFSVAGVTILTHYSEPYCLDHFGKSRHNVVRRLAYAASEAGCGAVVLPGDCLDHVRDIQLKKIVPGIRLTDSSHDGRHAVETTPEFAADHGADAIVCGYIMKADNPVNALIDLRARLGH